MCGGQGLELYMIDRLDRWLRANRPDYYNALQPGVSDDRLDAFESRFGLLLPPAFRLLYRWRDGQADSCSASFHHNLMFSSLTATADSKELLDGMIGFDF